MKRIGTVAVCFGSYRSLTHGRQAGVCHDPLNRLIVGLNIQKVCNAADVVQAWLPPSELIETRFEEVSSTIHEG
jgi:hypothetical protein